jgi:hypothetical protein
MQASTTDVLGSDARNRYVAGPTAMVDAKKSLTKKS